ncbi:hypothetical protein T01_3694 [Trichinella spiralis]|uniref:Uncharacterized protein n=2 Tax=Trichinella spiralis TaxID=6334 RepID=A0A0V1BPR5_TRISP|nr:hypothetical protein T01_3694 [Trichinella spiralis]
MKACRIALIIFAVSNPLRTDYPYAGFVSSSSLAQQQTVYQFAKFAHSTVQQNEMQYPIKEGNDRVPGGQNGLGEIGYAQSEIDHHVANHGSYAKRANTHEQSDDQFHVHPLPALGYVVAKSFNRTHLETDPHHQKQIYHQGGGEQQIDLHLRFDKIASIEYGHVGAKEQ